MTNTFNKRASFPCCAPEEASAETPAEAEEVTCRRLIVRSATRADILWCVRDLLEHDARAAERFPDAVDKSLGQLLDMPGMAALQAFTHPQHSKRNLRRIFSLKGKQMH